MRKRCRRSQIAPHLLGLIQVFIHDPLYKWALTPLGAQKRQKDDSATDSNPTEGAAPPATSVGMTAGSADSLLANADAERALLRLKQKLAGLEGGKTCQLSCYSGSNQAAPSEQIMHLVLPNADMRYSHEQIASGAYCICGWALQKTHCKFGQQNTPLRQVACHHFKHCDTHIARNSVGNTTHPPATGTGCLTIHTCPVCAIAITETNNRTCALLRALCVIKSFTKTVVDCALCIAI